MLSWTAAVVAKERNMANSMEDRSYDLARDAANSLESRKTNPATIENGLNQEMSRILEATQGRGTIIPTLVDLEYRSLLEKGSVIGTHGHIPSDRSGPTMPDVKLMRDENHKVTEIDFHSATDPYKSISCKPTENNHWVCDSSSAHK
jgi:hypothetical protein